MTNQNTSKDDAGQDGNLTELREDVVRRLEVVLDAVANRFFQPKLDGLREDIGKEIAGQATALSKLRKNHCDRLEAADQAQKELERKLDAVNSLQVTQFQQTGEKLGRLAARCDEAQGFLEHLNAEVGRLETLIQQHASVTGAAIVRLDARIVLTRRICWLLAAALFASYFLIFKRP